MKTPASPLPRRRAGFTLAEVMIALGIVASVMVGMLAALPHALRSIKDSNNLTVMGRIAQEVISDIQMSDWDDIEKNFENKQFLYDNEGLLFEGRDGQHETYEARVKLPQGQVELGQNLRYSTDHMRRVEVQVEYLTNGAYNKDERIRQKNTQVYNINVANQNKLKLVQ